MFRSVILAAARSKRVERLVETAPVTRDVVRRFVAGTSTADALHATRELVESGLAVSLDHLGEDTTTPDHVTARTRAYQDLLSGLAGAGLTPAAEVSLKLTALGQKLDERLAADQARVICQAAADAGTTVTLDMEDHTTTDSTLEILAELRKDFPDTGAVVQAYLRRTEADCRELARAGSRVRLVKGAYKEPEEVAYQRRLEVDRSFVRCLNILLAGQAHTMVATHDPRIIAIAEARLRWFERVPDTYEFQMLYGVRPAEQVRLAAAGHTMRVYVPYGTEWYGYLMRRIAERPANLAFFLRALRSKR